MLKITLKVAGKELEITLADAKALHAELAAVFGLPTYELDAIKRRIDELERSGRVLGPYQPSPWPWDRLKWNEVTCGVAAGAAGHVLQDKAARQGDV